MGFSYWEGLWSFRITSGQRATIARCPVESGTTKSFANRRGILVSPAAIRPLVRVPLAAGLMVAPRQHGANARGVRFLAPYFAQSAGIYRLGAGRNGGRTKRGFPLGIRRTKPVVPRRRLRLDGVLSALSRPPAPSSIDMSTTARTLAALLVSLAASSAIAQESNRPLINDEPAVDTSSWYGESTPQVTPRMIIQQKAQARAYQRMARMESMAWYGMSAARPTANSTPFMGIPSPRWQMPGGNPFGWVPPQQEVILVR